MKTKFFKYLVCSLFVCFAMATAAISQTTEFTYQGRLMDGSLPANASYDLEFKLFDLDTGGAELGTQTRNGVAVANGIFTVRLDFGAQFTGPARWLEIAVKSAGGPAFTLLTPRQPVTSAPYSIKSRNADTAANSTMLGGIAANQYVITTDTRMADARDPLPGSGNYVQNSLAQQVASNFNISGDGRVGGTVTANAVTSATHYNIGADRVFAVSSFSRNVFAGIGAGTSNGLGSNNSFFGAGAGQTNVSGANNSFFGRNAGQANTASENSFFGAEAGFGNSTGARNSTFGNQAGRSLAISSDNAFFGWRAGLNNTADENSFFGSRAGDSNTTGVSNAFFGFSAGSSNTISGHNSFFGFSAGGSSTGHSNSFFGSRAGEVSTGVENSFFGGGSGRANTTGFRNAFFGGSTGLENLSGTANSFFGYAAGQNNTTGSGNAFVGNFAGNFNTVADENSFFGSKSGLVNSTGSENSFYGSDSGNSNQTGNLNSFFGANAGEANSSGSSNTIIGSNADVSLTNLTFATAIGAGATVGSSNTVVLGRSSDVVIAPNRLFVHNSSDDAFALQIQGGAAFLGPATVQTSRLKILSPPNPGVTAEPLCLNTGTREVTFCDAQLNKTTETRDQSLFTELTEQKNTIETLQQQVDALKKIVCALKPGGDVCKENSK